MTERGGNAWNQIFGLDDKQSSLLLDIVSRRNPRLYERLQHGSAVSRLDADEIVNALGDELASSMDDDWEPNEYGRAVSAVLARFNAARIAEWP